MPASWHRANPRPFPERCRPASGYQHGVMAWAGWCYTSRGRCWAVGNVECEGGKVKKGGSTYRRPIMLVTGGYFPVVEVKRGVCL